MDVHVLPPSNHVKSGFCVRVVARAACVVLAEGEGPIKEVRRRTEAKGLLLKPRCHHCNNAGRTSSREREGCWRRREGEEEEEEEEGGRGGGFSCSAETTCTPTNKCERNGVISITEDPQICKTLRFRAKLEEQ
ncbi:unnamed protein product [Pleuronectes platessa]|uniref:Uncharacterized protein n=1 Tax=Pleuronectes platessa TaxID=8262 RepID=A0A9N7YM39_PLEPL|nr:unnamed protein product [Pleuronectes platessa]